MYELNNPYYRFPIKLVTLNGEMVGHLPKELSRITKFYLDRGASCMLKSLKTLQTLTLGSGWNENSMLDGQKNACYAKKYGNNREVFITG